MFHPQLRELCLFSCSPYRVHEAHQDFWIVFSESLLGFTSGSWKAWCSLASFAAKLGRSLVCSAEKPSRDFQRSGSFLYGAENNPFWLSQQTASGRTEDREQPGRTISSFLLLEEKCKNLHRGPDFSYFFWCIFFFLHTGLLCICKCWFLIIGLLSKFSLCSASFSVSVIPRGRGSWDHCSEALSKLSKVSGKSELHFTGFGPGPLFSLCLKLLRGKPGFTFSVCLNLKCAPSCPYTGDSTLI